jgi:hypothetical protein
MLDEIVSIAVYVDGYIGLIGVCYSQPLKFIFSSHVIYHLIIYKRLIYQRL